MITLEIGKYYKDRNGFVHGPIQTAYRFNSDTYPFIDECNATYTENGFYTIGKESGYDLVEEVTAEVDPLRSNIKEFPDDLGTIDTLEVITDHKVILKNPWSTLALCEDTGNGYIFRFPSNSSCNQDNYICMSYSEARSIVLCLSNFKEDLGFQE